MHEHIPFVMMSIIYLIKNTHNYCSCIRAQISNDVVFCK